MSDSVEDRLAIRELYDVYAEAAFRQDGDVYLSCWSDEGVRAAHGEALNGKAAILAHWTATWAMLEKMAFFSQLGAIRIEGDRAWARCHCLERLHFKGREPCDVVGIYTDELVREDGRWVFARRDYDLFMKGAGFPF